MFDIAIDLGTSYTSMYKQGDGLVLREPTVAAVRIGSTHEAVFGAEAKKLVGKTGGHMKLVFPVFEGVIIDKPLAAELLRYFFGKVFVKGLFKRRIRALVTVPCGVSPQEKADFEEAVLKAGAEEALLVDMPFAAALGIGIPVSDDVPVFFADIGGGVTDTAVVSLSGVIAGCGVSIGGNNVDSGLIEFMSSEYGLRIGLLTAEKIKNHIGSLYAGDNTGMTVNGRSAATGSPAGIVLTSRNIAPIITHYYSKIFDVIAATLNALPPEVSGEIRSSGLWLTGGGSGIAGVETFVGSRLGIPVRTVPDAAYAVITGAGKLLDNAKLLKKITGVG